MKCRLCDGPVKIYTRGLYELDGRSFDLVKCGDCGVVCTGGALCINGACTCPAGSTLCDGQCVNTRFDNDNCGECGISCTIPQRCANGVCR